MSYNKKIEKKAGEDMVIGIIGAGASGMAAALWAAENRNNQVVVFERQARVGRKLQATGNGRCNLTNLQDQLTHFHGDEPEFARLAVQAFDSRQTLQWFKGMGLFTAAEPSGRVYPYSDQANSVVDVLRFALEKENICLELGFEVTRLRRGETGFLVEGNGRTIACDRVIVACGGLAGTKLGGSMSGYQLLRSMGHKVTKLRPALVQIKCAWSGVTALKGVRANCSVRVLHDGKVHAASTGELQFTEYGLSGPVIFEVSRDVCRGAGEWICQLDFMPGFSMEELKAELLRRSKTALTCDDLLTGILHNRLGRVLTKAAGIAAGAPVSGLTAAQIDGVCRLIKCFEIVLAEPMGMDCAQVTAGGVVTAEFDPATMESRLVPGLYACGEVLDIDGDCGGYNLQWAWSSGRCAGISAGKE